MQVIARLQNNLLCVEWCIKLMAITQFRLLVFSWPAFTECLGM